MSRPQKKHWIMVKRGLSADPKHREAMGQAVWCFLHIIDRADFETGKVYDWRDGDEAEDMGVNERTLRSWRQALEKAGYIKCQQRQRGLEIIIWNWINPRDYSAGIVNPQGDKILSPSDAQGDINPAPSEFQGDIRVDIQGDMQVPEENVTPTYSSDTKSQESINSLSTDDFKKMSVEEARKVPELRLYAKATDFFPGSLSWHYVYTFIREHKLTEAQIHTAAEQWDLHGYQKTNIKGILEWALNGVPAKGKSNGNHKSSTPTSAGTGRKSDQNNPVPSAADIEAAKRVRARQANLS